MNFILKPSLQQMTLVKTAIALWNQKDIRSLILKYTLSTLSNDCKTTWQEVSNKVKANASHLPTPKPLKKDLQCLIKPIGHQIMAWCVYHRREKFQILNIPQQFSWTPEGTIDRKKTAEMLVKDEDIDVELRYKLACINCLEDEIPELWNQIAEDQKLSFHDVKTKSHKLVQFWTYHLIDKVGELEELIQKDGYSYPCYVYAFRCAVQDGNVVAAEFFFSKLSNENKDMFEYAVIAAAKYWNYPRRRPFYSSIFHFLLSRMSKNLLEEVFVECSRTVLSCFLDWPYQPFFLVAAERTVPLLSANYRCLTLVELITSKIVEGWTDFDYQQLFHGLWELILPVRKMRAASSILNSNTFLELLKRGERDIIASIFKHADDSNKEGLNLRGEILPILVREEKWNSIEFLLQMCKPTRGVLVEAKDTFMRRLVRSDEEGNSENREREEIDEGDRCKWETFFHFLDNFITKKNEIRKAEVDENNPRKRLCIK